MKKLFFTIFLISQFALSCFAITPEIDTKQYLNLNFWEKFQDENLVNNILIAYQNNLDLKIANLKVKESEKIVKLSLANELPQISFDGMLGRTFSSSDLLRGDNNFMIHSYRQSRFLIPLNASYEVDIWGKNRLKTKGKKQSLKMLEQDEKATYVILTSSVAVDYYNLIKTDKLLDLQTQMYNLTSVLLDLVSNKEKIGLANKDDVLELQAKQAQIQASINNLESKKEVLQNQLSYLLADKLFSQIQRSDFDNINLLDNMPHELNSGIILNRPDVLSAKENISRADFEARAAKRELLPTFTISGTLGFNGYNNFSHIFANHTGLGELWVMPNLDIFDGGKKYNIMRLKKLEYEQAQKEYEKAVISSIQEVNDSLAISKNENKNYELSKYVYEIQSKKTKLKLANKNSGLANEIDYILYQSEQILAQEKLVSDKINYIISSINLYRAVGGADFTSNL